MARLLTLFRDREWSPSSLSGLAATVLPAESRAAGLLWQDTAKTIPATADGDPVRVAVCPYTAVEFTAPSDATRPLLYEEGGGKWSLSFDGVDDRFDYTRSGSWAGDAPLCLGVVSESSAVNCYVFSGGDAITGQGRGVYREAAGFYRWIGYGRDVSTVALTSSPVSQVYRVASSTTVTVRDASGLNGPYTLPSPLAATATRNVKIGLGMDFLLPLSGRVRGFVVSDGPVGDDEAIILYNYLVTL